MKTSHIKLFSEDYSPIDSKQTKPVVQIPVEIRNTLNEAELVSLEKQCLSEYRKAKRVLEQSITDVAIQDTNALAFAKELSQRVLVIMKIAVALGLTPGNHINSNDDHLAKIGVPEGAIRNRSPDFLNEMKQETIKTQIISENGSITEAGFVGFSPLSIKNASTGNLRERMYIPYKSMHGFIGNLFLNPSHVTAINQALQEKNSGWQLNENVINELRTKTTGKDNGLFTCGVYADSREKSRVYKSEDSRKKYAEHNSTVQNMQTARIPLSKRELLTQTGDLNPDSNKRVKWLPGEAYFNVLESADERDDPMLAGISGTTDYILTLGYMTGVFDGEHREEKMRDCLVALIGWMVDTKDHTAHEILTSGNTFGLTYRPGPDA